MSVCVLGAGGGCAHACSLRIYAACYLLRFLNPCLVSVIYFDTCRPVYLPVFLLLCYLRLLFLFGTRITMSNLFQFHVAGCSFTFFFFLFLFLVPTCVCLESLLDLRPVFKLTGSSVSHAVSTDELLICYCVLIFQEALLFLS